MKYNPNLNDPRIQKRVRRAIGFTNACLSDIKPRSWSTRYIDKFFGHQGNDLSKWLRTKLLICTNERYSMDSGICKEYLKNPNGIMELVSLLEQVISYPSVIQVQTITKDFIKNEFKQELITKQFTYEDKSNRLWHPLQRVKREYKKQILDEHDFKFHYDIQCCAPTLIRQYSQMLENPMDEYLFALNEYLKDRKQVRQRLADETEITYDQAKEIINALLMGAKLANNDQSDIYHLLNGDKARIEFLKQNPFLTQFRADLKTCWDYIKPTLSKRVITTKTGKQRVLPISNKQKSMVYFDLERQVLNSIRSYLDNTNNKYFLEHDGFSCVNEVNKEELSKWVKMNTGFNIQLD